MKAILAFITLILSVASAPAGLLAAPCPTAADLDRGIILQRTDPLFVIWVRRAEDGFLLDRKVLNNGVLEGAKSFYLHPLVAERRQDARSVVRFEYDGDYTDLNQLDQTLFKVLPVTVFVDDEKMGAGAMSWGYEGTSTTTIGECAYETWTIRETFMLNDTIISRLEKHYSPDLQLNLKTIQFNANDEAEVAVIYDKILTGEGLP